MTNHWNDLQHADALLILGANPAENHPISFRWILKAKEKGAKLITVDPRYTRSAALSDIYAPMRSGSDIAFFGGMINYILENDLYFKEYVVNYTNASFVVGKDYKFDDGLFSGYDEEARKYDVSSWAFETDDDGTVVKDLTLQNPRCVYQLMKEHYSRYDLDTVSKTVGIPKEQYIQVLEAYCATGKKDKAGTMLYAMGITQHTVGTQNVRIMGMVQLLLGNIGIAGGGMQALRGVANVQGSCDFGLLFNIQPGYITVPYSSDADATYKSFLERITPSAGWMTNVPKFYTSLLKTYYGDAATKNNDFGYDMLPKLEVGVNYSYLYMMEAIDQGIIKGMFSWGSNPLVTAPDVKLTREVLGNLDWLVATDLFETETVSFWQKEAGNKPEKVNTEVFFLPAAGPFEREGSITNSGRWIQYRYAALAPKGDSRPDADIIHNIALKIKEKYAGENTPEAKAVNALDWDMEGEFGPGRVDVDKVYKEMNGFDLKTGKLVERFADLRDDGTTTSGCWIYTGMYTEEAGNKTKNRNNEDTDRMGNFHGWSFSWPVNRRVLYNRASCDLKGKPYNPDKVLIQWDASAGEAGEWVGGDVPDFAKDAAPDSERGAMPFIMHASGMGHLFANMNDGPFPEHYEPYDAPTKNVFSSVELNPAVIISDEKYLEAKGTTDKFPIIATTYRQSEHWQGGPMTRNKEWTAELAPHMYIEMSEALAKEKGISHTDKVIVSSVRGEIEAYALVTKRFRTFEINGEKKHHIGMPWHFGFKGVATGASANTLIAHIGDANSFIPESKAFLVDVRKVN